MPEDSSEYKNNSYKNTKDSRKQEETSGGEKKAT